jgi:hypothetical protein
MKNYDVLRNAYERDRAERLAARAPQRSDFDRPDFSAGRQQREDDARVRDVRRGRLADWWMRRYGKPATETQLDELDGQR